MGTYLSTAISIPTIRCFQLYRRRFEKLKSSRFLSRDEIQNTLNIQINLGLTAIEHKAPDDETVEYFATQLRPFVLEHDATSHNAVCAKAKRNVTDPGLKAWCALAGREYQALMLNPLLTGIPIFLGDDRILTPRRLFDLFMGSEGPHVFFDHTQQMEAFGKFVAVLKLDFIKLCVTLYLHPFQLLSDTLGIALGDLPPTPKALGGPSEKRVLEVDQMVAQGTLIHDTKLSDQKEQFPRFHFKKVLPAKH